MALSRGASRLSLHGRFLCGRFAAAIAPALLSNSTCRFAREAEVFRGRQVTHYQHRELLSLKTSNLKSARSLNVNWATVYNVFGCARQIAAAALYKNGNFAFLILVLSVDVQLSSQFANSRPHQLITSWPKLVDDLTVAELSLAQHVEVSAPT